MVKNVGFERNRRSFFALSAYKIKGVPGSRIDFKARPFLRVKVVLNDYLRCCR